jgi:hypothetical protein
MARARATDAPVAPRQPPPQQQPPGFLEAVAVGALSSGVNLPTFLALNAALFCVVLALVALLALSSRARPELVPHVFVLLLLATGLWGLLIWLVTTVGLEDAGKQRRELLGGGGDEQAAAARTADDDQDDDQEEEEEDEQPLHQQRSGVRQRARRRA